MGRGARGRGGPILTAGLALLALAACEETAPADGRPRGKPGELTAAIAGPGGQTTARVETAKGELLIMSLEGRVVPVPLDSADGRRALGESEAQIARAAKAAAAPADAGPKRTAQEALVAEFEAQRAPVLPEAGGDAKAPDPRQFLGASVAELLPDGSRVPAGRKAKGAGMRLVEVTADLKQGVDADTAFAYATCALAGWAARSGTPFARHIRTLQHGENGRLRIASVFTVSGVEPMGLKVVEARQTLGDCEARGIPAA